MEVADTNPETNKNLVLNKIDAKNRKDLEKCSNGVL